MQSRKEWRARAKKADSSFGWAREERREFEASVSFLPLILLLEKERLIPAKESEMVRRIKRRPLNEEKGRRWNMQIHRVGNKGAISRSVKSRGRAIFVGNCYLWHFYIIFFTFFFIPHFDQSSLMSRALLSLNRADETIENIFRSIASPFNPNFILIGTLYLPFDKSRLYVLYSNKSVILLRST